MLAIADRVRAAIARHVFSAAPTVHVTVSVGAASSPRDGDSPDAVLAAADHAMYAAKHMGRYRTYSAADPPDATRPAPPITHVLDCLLEQIRRAGAAR